MDLTFFVHLAYGALAVLIAVLAVYYALRLLGKIAKFAVVLIVAALVLWFVFSDHSIIQTIRGYIDVFRASGFTFESIRGVFGR